jgi:hypothetical protein
MTCHACLSPAGRAREDCDRLWVGEWGGLGWIDGKQELTNTAIRRNRPTATTRSMNRVRYVVVVAPLKEECRLPSRDGGVRGTEKGGSEEIDGEAEFSDA